MYADMLPPNESYCVFVSMCGIGADVHCSSGMVRDTGNLTRTTARTFRAYPCGVPWLSAAVHAEQPRNSAEIVKFSVSRTVCGAYVCIANVATYMMVERDCFAEDYCVCVAICRV